MSPNCTGRVQQMRRAFATVKEKEPSLFKSLLLLLTELWLGKNKVVSLVKAMVFPVVVGGCESWTIKKAEHWRIDASELWCWRRLSRVPWTARRSNQSILKEISPEYSLEGLMLKLKLQYFDHLMWRSDSLEKTLMLVLKVGGEVEVREWDGWMASLTQLTWVWVSPGSWWWTGKHGVLQSMGLQRVGYNWVTKLTDWLTDRTCWWTCWTSNHTRWTWNPMGTYRYLGCHMLFSQSRCILSRGLNFLSHGPNISHLSSLGH